MLEWDPSWTPDFAGHGWAHGGITSSPDRELVVTDPDQARLLVLDHNGRLTRTLETSATEAHGLGFSTVNGRPAIWIADTGWKVIVDGGRPGGRGPENGRVFAVDFDSGLVLLELDPPSHPLYRSMPYRPTFVAIDDADGGSGDVWVADGYGASLVHRYSSGGRYLGTLDGGRGAGRFDCPHGLHIDRRQTNPRLYVSDRGPHRIQVFGLDGGFQRSFGEDELTSPSGFAALGERLVIAELEARLVILDEDDHVESVVGADETAVRRPGWPNREGEDGLVYRPESFIAGRTNSPHAIATDGLGNLYLTEFVLGGRLSRLRATRDTHSNA